MALDPTNRARCAAQAMRDGAWAGVTKPDIIAAVAAVDDWVDASQASFNTALPQPFRGAATAEQKAFLLCYVVQRRVGRLRAEED